MKTNKLENETSLNNFLENIFKNETASFKRKQSRKWN